MIRDPGDGAVHALVAERVRTIQFHVESLLTVDGAAIPRSLLTGAAPDTDPSDDRLDSNDRVGHGAIDTGITNGSPGRKPRPDGDRSTAGQTVG